MPTFRSPSWIRDIRRKTMHSPDLRQAFAILLTRAEQIRRQRQQQRGWMLYSWHAPEVECIGKGKAHRPYEFGVKVSIATTNRRCKGGQFVLHAKALPGDPYDGHTLGRVIEETQALTGREIERVSLPKMPSGPILCDSEVCGMMSVDDGNFEAAVLGCRLVVQVA